MHDISTADSTGAPPPGLPTDGPPQLPAPDTSGVARWRWWLHLVMLAAYPTTIGLLSAVLHEEDSGPALSGSLTGLLLTVLQTYVFFGFFFGIAWAASRVRPADLMMRWRSGWKPWALGFGYSVALQIILRIVILAVLAVAVIGIMVQHGGTMNLEEIKESIQGLVQKFQPQTDKLVDGQALTSNPLYLLATMTLVSFAMAGFTEELWRAGMLAGFKRLFPSSFESLRGKLLFVFLIAVVFGIGHLRQGVGAVALTGMIGLLLGGIMLFHRSMWIAALTHGFFDATSFLTLWYIHSHPELLDQLQRSLPAN